MSSNLSFAIHCGRCFSEIFDNENGSVLSCGDFICSKCLEPDSNILDSCPACGKAGVRVANLRKGLPAEVCKSIVNVATSIDSIKTSLQFQVKHYKHIIKTLSSRLRER